MSAPLAGLAVLVTRPREHAQALVRRLTGLGAEVAQVPAIEIEPVEPGPDLAEGLGQAAAADWLVFVSRPAVRYGLARLREAGLALPQGAGLITVGPGSAAELEAAGLQATLHPRAGFNSEALLAMPALQRLSGQEVVIVRGVGGRELLGQTLALRGARVRYLEVYRRRAPDAATAAPLRQWQRRPRRLAIVTSQEGLANLVGLTDAADRAALLAADLVTVSERVVQAARTQGFQGRVVVALRPDDDGLTEAVLSVQEQDNHGNG